MCVLQILYCQQHKAGMWGANVAGNQVTLETVQEALNNPAAEQLPVSTQVSNLVASIAGE